MKYRNVIFLHDHQSAHSGNEFYKRGTEATFREANARVLVDGGHVAYTDSQEKPTLSRQADPKPLTTISGIGDELVIELNERGITTIADLANATIGQLTPISGIGLVKAGKLIEKAKAAL